MILKGTVSHAQSIKRDDFPKPDMEISQLGVIVLAGEQPKPNMDISQLGGVVLRGGGTTSMDISQLGSVVLHETEF